MSKHRAPKPKYSGLAIFGNSMLVLIFVWALLSLLNIINPAYIITVGLFGLFLEFAAASNHRYHHHFHDRW